MSLPRETDLEIVTGIAKGESVIKIGERLGIPRDTIYRKLRKDEFKRWIEEIQHGMVVLNADKALEGFSELVHKDPGKCDKDERKLQYDAYLQTMRATGALPSNAPSTVVLNLSQVNNFQNPMVQGILDQYIGKLREFDPDKDIVDAEVEDAKGKT